MSTIHEKILQYFKKYNVGDVALKVSNEEDESKNVKPVSAKTETQTEVIKEVSPPDEKEKLKTSLSKLKQEYDSVGDESVLQKMEYTPLTEEEIVEKASKNVDEKYGLKFNDLDLETEKKLKNLEEQASSISNSAKSQKQKIEELYKDAEEKVEQSAIKRGISRSSIVQEQLKDLDVEKISDLLSVDNAVASSLKENSNKIKELESDYLNAVNKLNVEKAIEISEKIEELTEKQNKKLDEVLKYNNTVTRQELQIKQEDKQSQNTTRKNEIKRKMLNLALNYYNTLPKESAYEEYLNDGEMKNLLGDVALLLERYLKVM